MMLHTLDLLIVLMAFAGYENHITLFCHHTGGTNGLFSVDDTHHLLHLLVVETRQHVVDDILRFLETGIIAGDNYLVAEFGSSLRHDRTLALITVATCATNGDDLSLTIKYLIDGVLHILQGIRRMGVVDDCRIALRRMDGFQTSADTLQRAKDDEDILWLLA